jgi:hypothetical protein
MSTADARHPAPSFSLEVLGRNAILDLRGFLTTGRAVEAMTACEALPPHVTSLRADIGASSAVLRASLHADGMRAHGLTVVWFVTRAPHPCAAHGIWSSFHCSLTRNNSSILS